MVNHCCCAYNCSNSTQKQKNYLKYPELKGITFHTFPVDDRKKTFVSGMNESERKERWIAACRLSSLNVTRHTRICSAHFEGGLGPTKLNPTPTIFSFPSHLQTKTHRERTDPEERRRKSLCLQNRSEAVPREKEEKANWRRAKKMKNQRQSDYDQKKVRFQAKWANLQSVKHNLQQQLMTHNQINLEGLRIHVKIIHHLEIYHLRIHHPLLTNVPSLVKLLLITYMEVAKTKLEDKQELKREIFMVDKPLAHAMKYWDNRKKGQRETYQI